MKLSDFNPFKKKKIEIPDNPLDRIPDAWKKNTPTVSTEEPVEEQTLPPVKKKPGRPAKKSKVTEAMEQPVVKVQELTRKIKFRSKNRRELQNSIRIPHLLKIKRMIAGILLVCMGVSAVTLLWAYLPLTPIAILNGWILLDYVWKTRGESPSEHKFTTPEELAVWLKKNNVSLVEEKE